MVVQRRAVRVTADLPAGTVLSAAALTVLRPAPTDSINPYQISDVIGKTLRRPLKSGEHVQWTDLKQAS